MKIQVIKKALDQDSARKFILCFEDFARKLLIFMFFKKINKLIINSIQLILEIVTK